MIFKDSSQTKHTIEKVFTPFGLPGVSFSIEEEVFDFALIKFGNVMDGADYNLRDLRNLLIQIKTSMIATPKMRRNAGRSLLPNCPTRTQFSNFNRMSWLSVNYSEFSVNSPLK